MPTFLLFLLLRSPSFPQIFPVVTARIEPFIYFEEDRQACLDALTGLVEEAEIGPLSQKIPTRWHPTVAAELSRAIAAGLSEGEAMVIFQRKLAVIPDEGLRSELAESASEVVANPPKECSQLRDAGHAIRESASTPPIA